jgi:probable phosphoglycerate mutase
MKRLVVGLAILATAVLFLPTGGQGTASAQPGASVANDWTPPQRRRLVLMRHGDVAYFDANGQPVSDPDKVMLSEKGRAEADATGAYLKGIGLGSFDRVISSTLPRTIETAERVMKILGETGEPTKLEALQEIRIGSAQMIRDIPTPELPRAIMGIAQPHVSGDQNFLRGETIAALQARVFPALDSLLADGSWQTALLVLHGVVNTAILSHALTGDAAYYGRFDPGAGCFSIIDVGANFSDAVIKAVNICPNPAPYLSHALAVELLLEQNLRARALSR